MIALLKVYETLYQNDEHEILYVMILKSEFSDHLCKSVLLPYWMQMIESGINMDEFYLFLNAILVKTSATLRCLNEAVTLILIREIYYCTCSMEVRRVNRGATWKRVLATTLAVFLPNIIYELVGFLTVRGKAFALNSAALSSSEMTNVVPELMSIFIVVATLYYATHILLTLTKSNHFRGQAGHTDRKNVFVTMLVIVISAIRILHLLILIAKIVLTANLLRQLMAGGFIEKPLELLDNAAQIGYLEMGYPALGVFELCYVWIPGTMTRVMAWRRGELPQ